MTDQFSPEGIAAMSDDMREMLGINDDGTIPELHPDLVPYIQETDRFSTGGMTVLKHPYVFQIPYDPHLAGMANVTYERKKEAIQEAIRDKNWGRYFLLIERPYRIDAFEQVCWRLTNKEFWEELGDLWTDTENLWQNHETWRELLTCGRRDRRKYLMTEDERQFIKALGGPGCKTVTVYRGTCAPDGMGAGFSWTLNRPKAEWFARRFQHIGPEKVIVGTLRKSKIIAYFDRRNEWEIICLPEDVTIEEDAPSSNDEE